jgi:hypothetical protein
MGSSTDQVTAGSPTEPGGRIGRADLLGVGFCIAFGLALAVLPHFIAWVRTGSPIWFADGDDFSLYAPMASQAYHHEATRLADPVVPEGGDSYFASLPVIPGVLLARWCGLGPLSINLVWRCQGGAVVGLLWYLLLRAYVRRPLYAAGLTLVLLADGGVVAGQLGFGQVKPLVRVATLPTGELLNGPANLLPQWRVLNPALTWPWLLLYVWLLARARQQPRPLRVVLAGLSFGLLFHVYFYLWTGAGLGLMLAMLLDRAAWKQYLAVGVVGLLVGAPALWAGYRFKQTYGTDWMLRSDKFLPIGHFAELLLPRVTIGLLALSLVWVWWRRRDLIYLWALAAAGLVLLNQQLVTGLQIENFHWNLVLGPSLALLCLLLLAGWLAARPRRSWAVATVLGTLLAVELAGGLWLRWADATCFAEPQEIATAVRQYLAQRPPGETPPLAGNAVVAGDKFFVDPALIQEDLRPLYQYAVDLSAAVDNQEWDTRVALNSYLRGLDRAGFLAEQNAWLDRIPWGPWAPGRSAAARHARLAGRLAAWDAVVADPAAQLDRFRVRYLALRVGAKADHLGSEWYRLEAGPTWQVWERRPTGLLTRK